MQLELRAGHLAARLHQLAIVALVGNSGHRTYLRVAELTFGKRLVDDGQLRELTRHADMVVRGAHRHAGAKREPLFAAALAIALPAPRFIERTNHLAQLLGSRVDVGGERYDSVRQLANLVGHVDNFTGLHILGR